MKVVFGLGNPGRKYEGTRHNVGFAVLAELVRRHGGGSPRSGFQADLTEVGLKDDKVLLVAPQTFMNLSGTTAVAVRDFYKLSHGDLLVVCDDFNLPLGQLRMRPQGSAGGQNGLADILQRLGSDDIPRLRFGIGPVPGGWDPADFVFGRFAKAEVPEMEVSVALAADAVEAWVGDGIAASMNRYNK